MARNWLSRYPLAEWTSTPAAPARTASRAAAAKSATVSRMSSVVISRGTGASRCPLGVWTVPGSAIGEGATGTSPLLSGWPMRPPCSICRKIRPPAAVTASAT
nr:hypothetical protein [Stackebrandtia albiflava]